MRTNTIWMLLASALLWVACLVPQHSYAQGLTSLVPSGGSATTDIDDVLRAASENGVSVIVIDSNGTVLSEIGDAPPLEEAEKSGLTLISVQDSAAAFRTALVTRFLQLPSAFSEVLQILRSSSPDGTIFAYVKVLLLSLLLLGLGILFQHYVYGKHMAKRFVVARIRENPHGYAEKMPFLIFRFFMGVIGILLSIAVAYVLGSIFFGPLKDPSLQFTATLINVGYLSIRVVINVWRMIVSPFLPQYRIPKLSNADARRLFHWLSAGTILGISAFLFGQWIRSFGLNQDVYVFLFSLLSLVVMLQSVALVLFNRRSVTAAILNDGSAGHASWVLRTLSRAWAPTSILFFVFAWGNQTYHLVLGALNGTPLLLGGWVILTTIIVVYGVLNYVIERSFTRARLIEEHKLKIAENSEGLDPEQLLTASGGLTSFQALARRVAGIVAFVAGVYAFIRMWSPESGIVADSFANQFLSVAIVLFLGNISYYAFRIWIDQKIAEEQGDMEDGELGDEGGGTSASRLATLLPLFRNFILIVIVVIIALITLMEMGVNVAPLFAGAGIIGVAVGFGSQSLVRDIFSGAFFLFDDAFRRGEYIDVGGVKGTVEKISVRSFQLRHHLGALHTMPFGEIQVLTNYSRDWVIMKLPLRVTYDTDVEKVRKMIKNLGVALLDDPVIGDNFIQPLKSQGVIEMQDSAMIIRVKFMTKPGDQWLVRKKVYEEIRQLFELNGIKFAHREVTVRLADGQRAEDLNEEDRKAITAAAQASLEEDLLDGEDADGDDR
ncbi:MAG: mechanosensitive ion channel domain-containing protein [Tateyamaria sp.]|uniref:mechanosensitive ion channel domain-containing protein n=1 Tax=Tateyamaria sp. TaxID=1929288 RepID=UPI003296076E